MENSRKGRIVVMPTRYRKVKKHNGSYFICLDEQDLIDFGFKDGDLIDISDCILISEGLHKLKFGNEDCEVKNE